MRHTTVAAALGAAFLAVPAGAVPPGKPATKTDAVAPAEAPVDDRDLLRAAGVADNATGILGYFRRRSPSSGERARAAACVARLVDDDFAERQRASAELVRLGLAALPALRDGLRHTDPEVAERCAAALAALTPDKMAAATCAAVRRLKKLAPDGAVAVLLDWLPDAENAAAEEEALYALAAIGCRAGAVDPALSAAASDPNPARRAAAGIVLGRSGGVDGRARARGLLTDPDPRVRFRAAQGLLAGRDRAAAPALAAALTDAPTEFAARAEELLRCLAAGRGPSANLLEGDDPAAQARCRKAWDGWLKSSGGGGLDRADVDLPPYNPTLRAAAAARDFLSAAFGGDAAAAERLSRVPFFVGDQLIGTREDLKTLFSNGAPPGTVTTAFAGTVRLSDVVAAAGPDGKKFLASFRPSGVRVLGIRLRAPGGGALVEPMAVLVELSDEGCRVRGIFPRAAPVQLAR